MNRPLGEQMKSPRYRRTDLTARSDVGQYSVGCVDGTCVFIIVDGRLVGLCDGTMLGSMDDGSNDGLLLYGTTGAEDGRLLLVLDDKSDAAAAV